MADDQGAFEGVTFGLFDWLDSDRRNDLAAFYKTRIEVAKSAEANGFDIYHLAEHHGAPLGLAPSPNVFLTAVASATSQIRICPLVYVLPLYDPVRLVEEIGMLDHLSGGRLEVGLGRGSNEFELDYFGLEPEAAAHRFNEVFADVLESLRTGMVGANRLREVPERETGAGDLSLWTPTLQDPHPPVWYPTINPESIERIGRQGHNTIVGFGFISPTLDEMAERRDEFEEAVASSASSASIPGAGASTSRFGLLRHVYVDETDDKARQVAVPALEKHYENYIYLRKLHGDTRHPYTRDWDELIDDGLALVGSPETVRERLTEIVERGRINHFAGAFAFGDLERDRVESSMTLFADEVITRSR